MANKQPKVVLSNEVIDGNEYYVVRDAKTGEIISKEAI